MMDHWEYAVAGGTALAVALLLLVLLVRRRPAKSGFAVPAPSEPAPPAPPGDLGSDPAVLGLKREVARLRQEVQELREEVRTARTPPPAPSGGYSDAITLAREGADALTVAGRCGISRSEAELIVAMHGKAVH